MNAHDIESLERATIAAVSPDTLEEMDGWLLPLDSGTISRAKSAVPLAHAAPAGDMVTRIETHYRAHGAKPVFRIADVPCFDHVRGQLMQLGYRTERPVLVQVAPVRAVRRVSGRPLADMAPTPDAAWAALFLGEGFDAVDGASRVASLSRAQGSLFASVRQSAGTLAAGAGSFSHGWAGVHGMRTALAHRGKGLAGQVLAALAEAAIQRGLDRVFLQVEEENTAARALYQRAGFETVWRYGYWRSA